MKKSRTVAKLWSLGNRLVGRSRPIILMYHRVANLAVDPWQLSVTPHHFRAQIELLKRNRDVVPMCWLAKRLREGRLDNGAAAITFDDGYVDVVENALPILKELECPATVFVTSRAIGGSGFWWDVLSRVILETPELPRNWTMRIAGTRLTWHTGNDPGTVGREVLHGELHALLKRMDHVSRNSVLEELAEWAQARSALRTSDRTMTTSELQQLSACQEIEIGAHSLTHPSLPLLEPNELWREVVESAFECEALSGRQVVGFAYPFGDYDDACVNAVRAAGLQYAVAAFRRDLGPKTDAYKIPRILIADWGEDDFVRKVLSHG